MEPRIVCQFSCGAASAVATKLALSKYGDRCEIINAYLKNEHLAKLRELAAQEPPAHDCALRKDILAAREELARRNLIVSAAF